MPPPVPPTVPTVELPRWCTAPVAPADIVVPASGRLDVGYSPSERPPAQYFNWFMNRAYVWIKYLSDFRLYLVDFITAAFYGSVNRTRMVNIANAQPLSTSDTVFSESWIWWSIAALQNGWRSQANNGLLFIPLDQLPHGSVYTNVVVRFEPGAARLPAYLMTFRLMEVASDGSMIQLAYDEDDGSALEQTVSMSPPPIVYSGSAYVVIVKSGNDGATNHDYVLGVTTTFADASPRLPT